MKNLFYLAAFILVPLLTFAQQKGRDHQEPKHPNDNIEHFVSDLTATQKTRIDIIARRSRENVEKYRKELDITRDSIRSLTDSPEDRSDILFPLYDREAALQAEISKEYYRAKSSIDAVLTPEQYKTLRSKIKEPLPHDPNRPPLPPPDDKK